MSESTWQTLAGLAGLAAVGFGFALGLTRHQVNELRAELAAEQAKDHERVIEHVVRQPCPDQVPETSTAPPGTVCRGGVLLEKTAGGWNSVIVQGRAVRCHE